MTRREEKMAGAFLKHMNILFAGGKPAVGAFYCLSPILRFSESLHTAASATTTHRLIRPEEKVGPSKPCSNGNRQDAHIFRTTMTHEALIRCSMTNNVSN
jgi:hypothetical protein